MPFNRRNNSSCATRKEPTDERLITMNAAVQCSLCSKKKTTHAERNKKCPSHSPYRTMLISSNAMHAYETHIKENAMPEVVRKKE
jgi:hypothetical protein